MSEDDDFVGAGAKLFREKAAAQLCATAEQLKELRGNATARHALDLVAYGQIGVDPAPGRHSLERGVPLLPGDEVGIRKSELRLLPAYLRERHQSFGVRVGQRLKQHRVDAAEDHGVGADAERERDDRNKSDV